jgi:hypothetical protein
MPNNAWMGTHADTDTLASLVMPGSHDACMYECRSGAAASAITQFGTISEQLNAGARFFDVRLYYKNSCLRAGHFVSKSSATFGSYGPAFDTVATDIKNFLDANPSELVLLKISLSKDAASTSKGDGANRIQTLFGDKLYESAAPKNLASCPLGAAADATSLRGKVLALFDKAPSVHQTKLHLANKTPPNAGGGADALTSAGRSIMWLNGNAPTSNSIADVLRKQNTARAESQARSLEPHLKMFYLTITASTGDFFRNKMSVLSNTARELGLTAQPRETAAAHRSPSGSWAPGADVQYRTQVDRVTGTQPNIFMLDFITEDVCNGVLAP